MDNLFTRKARKKQVPRPVNPIVASAIYPAIDSAVSSAIRSAVDSALYPAVTSAVHSAIDSAVAENKVNSKVLKHLLSREAI